MYQALYRKYRPSRFSDVVGQEHITQTLKNELKSGKIFHAYLFTGPRGTGKTSCAKILAKAVNCLSPVDGDACGECDICKAIDHNEILDIIEIDAASNNGVDNIRELKEQVYYAPSAAKYRVYIIDEVHMLSSGAFNAMLKTLEEPPAHIIFILATTEVQKLPATILSRCQRFDFHRIENSCLKERILKVAEAENIEIDDAAAELIASLSDGGMRDALSTLDLCSAHTKHITEKDVEQVCALSGREYCHEMADAVLECNTAKTLDIIGQLHKNAVDMQRLCNELVDHYRNLMIYKSVKDPSGLVVCSAAEGEKLTEQAARYSIEQVLYCMSELSGALEKMNSSNRKAEMEMAAVKLCNPTLCDSNEALLARIEKLERAVKYGAAVNQAVLKPAEISTERPKDTVNEQVGQNREIEIGSTNGSEIGSQESEKDNEVTATKSVSQNTDGPSVSGEPVPFDAWQDVLSELSKTDLPMYGVLCDSLAYCDGDVLLIDSKNEMFKTLAKQKVHRDSIRNAVKVLVGREYRLGPYKRLDKEKQEDPLKKIAAVLGQPTENN